jgi:hypothetical protein
VAALLVTAPSGWSNLPEVCSPRWRPIPASAPIGIGCELARDARISNQAITNDLEQAEQIIVEAMQQQDCGNLRGTLTRLADALDKAILAVHLQNELS